MTESTFKTTLAMGLLALCLIWMDACLYFQIQSIDETDVVHCSVIADHQQQQKEQIHNYDQKITSPKRPTTINLTLDQLTSNHQVVMLPLMDKFSFAFQGMSIKLMMTDPVDNYLLAPLSEALADMINLRENFTFITANVVSFAGVVSALMGAKLVTYDSLTMHRLSCLLFQIRTWLDDLDGTVARARMGINKHVSLTKTSGYVVDGVCDAIGFVAYVIGCYVFMRSTIRRRRRIGCGKRATANSSMFSRNYSLQSITEIETSDDFESNGHKATQDYIPLEYKASDGTSVVDVADEQLESRCGEEEEDSESTNEEDDQEAILHCNTLDRVEVRGAGLNGKVAHEQRTEQRLFSTNNLTQQMLPKTTRILLKKFKTKSGNLVFYRYIRDKLRDNLNDRHLVLLVSCFLLQLAMCSAFWNRYILVYQDLLESPSTNELQFKLKRKVLKSNLMYIIIWFWRLTNGHSFMQMLITAVFFGKLWQFLEFIKYVGLIEITLLALVTELHIIDVRNLANLHSQS